MNQNNHFRPQDHVLIQIALGANLITQKEIDRMVKTNPSNKGDVMISILSIARERLRRI